jgi:hypothetical protein
MNETNTFCPIARKDVDCRTCKAYILSHAEIETNHNGEYKPYAAEHMKVISAKCNLGVF